MSTKVLIYEICIMGRSIAWTDTAFLKDVIRKHIGQDAHGYWSFRNDAICGQCINSRENLINSPAQKRYRRFLELVVLHIHRPKRRNQVEHGKRRINYELWAPEIHCLE